MVRNKNNTRRCYKCGRTLSLTKFGKRSINKDGKDYRCKSCNRKAAKVWRLAHLSQAREISRTGYRRKLINDPEYNAKQYQKNYIYNLLSNAKRRAKLKKIPFDLIIEDISVPELCPVLGIPLVPAFGTGKITDGSPTIDRMDHALGYIKGNVHIISNRANRIKNDATLNELEKVLEYMRKFHEGKRNTK